MHTLSIDVKVEEGLREFFSVVGNLKHVRIESSQMEDELSKTTHRQLEGHLGEGGRKERGEEGGREGEREGRGRERERERKRGDDEIKLAISSPTEHNL